MTLRIILLKIRIIATLGQQHPAHNYLKPHIEPETIGCSKSSRLNDRMVFICVVLLSLSACILVAFIEIYHVKSALAKSTAL